MFSTREVTIITLISSFVIGVGGSLLVIGIAMAALDVVYVTPLIAIMWAALSLLAWVTSFAIMRPMWNA